MRIKRADLHKPLGNLPTQSKCIIDVSYYHHFFSEDREQKEV